MKKKPVVDILALTLIVCSIFSGCGKGRNTTNTTTDASDRELIVNIHLSESDDIASEVLKEAFGDRATFDENSYILRPGISRRTELVPAISVVLEAFPKEN